MSPPAKVRTVSETIRQRLDELIVDVVRLGEALPLFGLLAAALGTRAIQGLLHGVQPLDAPTFAAAAVGFSRLRRWRHGIRPILLRRSTPLKRFALSNQTSSADLRAPSAASD